MLNLNTEKKLLIIGEGGIAHTVYECFLQNTKYEICAFVVEKEYIKCDSYFELPVVAIEEIENLYPPQEHDFFVGIGGNQLNELRTRLYTLMKDKGYTPASCISLKSTIYPSATIGDHCCIFENVVIHSGCVIGNNVFILPQSFIGEYSRIDDNSFVAGQVSLAGYSHVGKFCYLGTHASVLNCVQLGDFSVVGAGSVAAKSTLNDTLVRMDSANYFPDAKKRFVKWFKRVSKLARG